MMGRVGDEPAGNEPAPLIRPLSKQETNPMASVFKPKGSRKYRILYFDENGSRRQTTGCTDKAESSSGSPTTSRIKLALRRDGLTDRKAEAYRDHEASPLVEQVADWQADLIAKGYTSKHAEHTSNRVRRLVTVILGSSPSEFDPRLLAPSEHREMTKRLETAIARARLSLSDSPIRSRRALPGFEIPVRRFRPATTIEPPSERSRTGATSPAEPEKTNCVA